MDSLGSSSDVSSNKTATLASGILSSLNSLFGTNGGTSGLFESLLAEEKASTPVTSSPTHVADPNASTQNTSPQDSSADASQDSDPNSLGAIKTILGGLHRIIDKLNKQSSQTDNSKTASASSTASTSAASQAQASSPSNSSANAASAASSTGTSDGDSSASDPTSLTGILSDLNALMKLMEKRLEAAQASASDTTTGSQTATAGATSGAASAADPLTQLLALMQQMQKQLTAALNGTSATGATAATDTSTASTTAQESPAAEALQDLLQVQKDIKGLLAALEGATGKDTTAAGNSSDGSGAANVATASTGNLLKSNDQTAAGKTSLATSDSVFNLLGGAFNNYNSVPVPTFSPANANADMASIASGASSGTPGQNNDPLFSDNTNNSANLNSLSTNNLSAFSGTADNTKSVDPYAFASQLSAVRAANGGTTGLTDPVEQVLLQINRGVKDGNDQMTIQLHPAELGKINVKLEISNDGQVRGTVTADNPATLNMLHKDSRSLERALQEAGLRADPGSLQFNMNNQSNNTSGQTANNSSGKASLDSAATLDEGVTTMDAASGADEIYYVTPGRVNLKV